MIKIFAIHGGEQKTNKMSEKLFPAASLETLFDEIVMAISLLFLYQLSLLAMMLHFISDNKLDQLVPLIEKFLSLNWTTFGKVNGAHDAAAISCPNRPHFVCQEHLKDFIITYAHVLQLSKEQN